MAEPTLRSDAASAAQCQSTIVREAIEIDHLRQRLAEARPAEELLAALATVAAAGTIGSSVSHARVMQMIVETAAGVTGARSAAFFRLDAASGELVFEVALGPKAEEVKPHRVQLGHGIAGLVRQTAWQGELERETCLTLLRVFAAPHITGIVARILAKHPGMTQYEMKCVPRALAANATPAPAPDLAQGDDPGTPRRS